MALSSSAALAGSGEGALGQGRQEFAAWRADHTLHERTLEEAERAEAIDAYRRWRADAARRKGFRTAAIGAAGAGDFDLARQTLARARRAARARASAPRPVLGRIGLNAARRAYDRALRLAARFAREGRPDLSQEAADFAAEIAIEHGLEARAARHERRSAAILRAAKENLVSALLAETRWRVSRGELATARVALAAAAGVRAPWTARQKEEARALARRITESRQRGVLLKSRPWERPEAARGFFGAAFSTSFSPAPGGGFGGAGATY